MSIKTTGCVCSIKDLTDMEALEQIPYDVLVPARNVYELFQNNTALHGSRPALTMLEMNLDEPALQLTHAQLLGEITRAANMFTSLGLGPSDVVSIVSPVFAPIPAMIWGAQTTCIVSCLNHLLSTDALIALLRVQRAKVLVCPGPELDQALWERLVVALDCVDSLQGIVAIGGAPTRHERIHDLGTLLASQPADRLLRAPLTDRDAPAALFHTGGTTGRPKLVPQTHGNIIHAAWSFAQAFSITERDVGLNGLPMFHVGGTSTWGLSILGAAGHVVVLSPAGFRNREVVRRYWELVERYKATMVGSVPTSIAALADVPVGDHDISSARMAQTGGAILPAAVAQRFEQRTGIPLLEQYGMTETVATIASTPFDGKRVRGSVGTRCPFSSIRVVRADRDDTLVDCRPGEIGSVVIKGRQVFSGYVDPQDNATAWTPDGWFITGDLGHLDRHGYLFLAGREKDLIIRSGHNIDPSSIESVANAHPCVALSAAVGMPDAYAGEVPVLFVTRAPGKSIDEQELAGYMQARVDEPPARPRHIFVIDAMPLTAVGKIFKPALREISVKEKLRMEVASLSDGVVVEDVLVGEAANSSEVILRISSPDRIDFDRGGVENKLRGALMDLTFKTRIEWV